MNLHFLINLIKHYWQATFIDVLHSPFVFNFYNQCIKRQKLGSYNILTIENLRKSLFKNNTEIDYTDFGASNFSRKTTIKKIAKTHLKPARIAQVLYFTVKHLKPKNSIELGTSLGITTAYIATAIENNTNFLSIEGCKDIYKQASENLTKLNLQNNVKLLHGNFNNLFEPTLNNINTIDFLFIDGNHSYQATIAYFKMALNKINNQSVLIFDDIYWSKGMTKAWNEIKLHENVTVTIDLFFIGFVFFRKEQTKQNFKLRIF